MEASLAPPVFDEREAAHLLEDDRRVRVLELPSLGIAQGAIERGRDEPYDIARRQERTTIVEEGLLHRAHEVPTSRGGAGVDAGEASRERERALGDARPGHVAARQVQRRREAPQVCEARREAHERDGERRVVEQLIELAAAELRGARHLVAVRSVEHRLERVLSGLARGGLGGTQLEQRAWVLAFFRDEGEVALGVPRLEYPPAGAELRGPARALLRRSEAHPKRRGAQHLEAVNEVSVHAVVRHVAARVLRKREHDAPHGRSPARAVHRRAHRGCRSARSPPAPGPGWRRAPGPRSAPPPRPEE